MDVSCLLIVSPIFFIHVISMPTRKKYHYQFKIKAALPYLPVHYFCKILYRQQTCHMNHIKLLPSLTCPQTSSCFLCLQTSVGVPPHTPCLYVYHSNATQFTTGTKNVSERTFWIFLMTATDSKYQVQQKDANMGSSGSNTEGIKRQDICYCLMQ